MCGIFAVYHKSGFNKDNYIDDKLYNGKLTEYIDILIDNARLLKHRGTNDNYRVINNKLLFNTNNATIRL